MKASCQICDEWLSSDVINLLPDSNFSDNSIFSIITEMAPKFDDFMTYCKLFNRVSKCEELFYPIFTDEGQCYTFNSMQTKDVITNE